jgi:hypothetical protein
MQMILRKVLLAAVVFVYCVSSSNGQAPAADKNGAVTKVKRVSSRLSVDDEIQETIIRHFLSGKWAKQASLHFIALREGGTLGECKEQLSDALLQRLQTRFPSVRRMSQGTYTLNEKGLVVLEKGTDHEGIVITVNNIKKLDANSAHVWAGTRDVHGSCATTYCLVRKEGKWEVTGTTGEVAFCCSMR